MTGVRPTTDALVLAGLDGRTGELCTTPAGVVLRLCRRDEPQPYAVFALRDVLTLSSGRPWRLESGAADGWSVTSQGRHATVACRQGPLAVELDLHFDEHGLLALDVVWRNESSAPLVDAALGLVLDTAEPDARVTVPHMIYNDNPSADPSRPVPRLGSHPGGGFVCEEDRLPVPGVNLEWTTAGRTRYLSALTRPERHEGEARGSAGTVRYGSLGVVRRQGVAVAVLSGVLMFDGRPDVRYVSKAETQPASEGYLELAPGQQVSRRCLLDWGRPRHPGHGFRHLVDAARAVFTEPGARPLDLDDIVRYKTSALDSRWHAEPGGVAGYTKFSVVGGNGPRKPAHFLYGWTGQCLRLAWCDARLGFESRQRSRIERCRDATDFYVRGSGISATPGLRMSSYLYESGSWGTFRRDGRPMLSSRAYGETLADLAEIVLLFREHGEPVPPEWTDTLTTAVEFLRHARLPEGIFPLGWGLDGAPAGDLVCAAGIPCALATLKAYRVTGDASYLADAEAWLLRYHELHAATFDRPFAHATLDAGCEDKEAGMGYFLAAHELYILTGDPCYAEWAEVAADWLLTFVYVWSPRFDAGAQLDGAAFSAVGWPGVSVQNHHLDVFFPAYELMDLGRRTGLMRYQQAAETVIHAMGQTICTKPGEWGFPVVGEQGEAVFQTHWQRRGTANTWNPSWVIALVLSNALRIRAAGRG